MNCSSSSPARSRFASAFSLIELLMVIAIIGVLSSLVVVGVGGVSRGSGVRGAADLAASLALSARVEAMSLGRGALLVVDDSSRDDRKLQRMTVLRGVEAEDGTRSWEISGSTLTLPSGVFFLPEYSKGWTQTNLSGFPGVTLTPVYAFEFDGSGRMVNASRMVFSGGMMKDGVLTVPDNMLVGRRGFQLFKSGRPAFFQNAEDMLPNP